MCVVGWENVWKGNETKTCEILIKFDELRLGKNYSHNRFFLLYPLHFHIHKAMQKHRVGASGWYKLY
jgi:hypothetical protein